MKICLYSSVSEDALFSRVGFYRDDLKALSLRGDEILPTNSIKKLLEFKPDLVVGYFYSKSILAALVGRFIGAKVILTGGADQISTSLLSGYQLLIRRIMALICLLLSHRILLACTDDLNNFRKLCFGITALLKKIELVNHVVISASSARIPSVPVRGEFNAFTLCWMGTVSNVRRKGVDKAIILIAKLRVLGVDARLDIAGTDGPGRGYLEALCLELGITNYVNFLGVIDEDEKNERFSNGSVYIQLSEHEGFGVAAAEAFFSGMIVVHSNKGGLADVIGEQGLILDIKVFQQADLSWVNDFYANFLKYKINADFLKQNFKRYSIGMRSDAFLGKNNV
jgi:glycosyltransferase involved in cell wall biosynthesis